MRPNRALIVTLFLTLLVLAPVVILKKNPSFFREPVSIPITILSRAEGKIYHLDLEQYLVGAVAAEMPAKFSLEALKAQAVAARTLAVRRLRRFGGKGCLHDQGADLCDDPGESQAWLSVGSLYKNWGERDFSENLNRIKEAVRRTSGVIMTFQGRPIDAVFHSTCGVGTADAREIWPNPAPYLYSVECGFDHHAPRYRSQVFFTWTELGRFFNLPTNVVRGIRKVAYSPRGRVLELAIGRSHITGNAFRRALKLNSTCFTWEKSQNGLLFSITGYGHGVGLCQYGADGMGKQGWSYQKILRHYYRGISFCKIKY